MKPQVQKWSWLPEIVSALFIILFIYTAVSKLVNREEFEGILWQNSIIGHRATLLSWLIPNTEIITALLLATRRLNRVGLWIASFLMTGFTLYIIVSKLLLIDLPCYCGGFIRDMTWDQHLVFNTVFIVMGITALVAGKNKKYAQAGVEILHCNEQAESRTPVEKSRRFHHPN